MVNSYEAANCQGWKAQWKLSPLCFLELESRLASAPTGIFDLESPLPYHHIIIIGVFSMPQYKMSISRKYTRYLLLMDSRCCAVSSWPNALATSCGNGEALKTNSPADELRTNSMNCLASVSAAAYTNNSKLWSGCKGFPEFMLPVKGILMKDLWCNMMVKLYPDNSLRSLDNLPLISRQIRILSKLGLVCCCEGWSL